MREFLRVFCVLLVKGILGEVLKGFDGSKDGYLLRQKSIEGLIAI